MLIKDIRYPKLKALAKKYAKDQIPDIPDKDIPNQKLLNSFTWHDTLQDVLFWDLVNCGNYKEARKIFDWDKVVDDEEIEGYQKDIEIKIDDSDYDFSEIVDALNNKVFNPQPHYDNSKGSLYKVATERGWNAYLFDVVKRIERGGKKENNPLRQEIEKSIDVLKIWLNELPNE